MRRPARRRGFLAFGVVAVIALAACAPVATPPTPPPTPPPPSPPTLPSGQCSTSSSASGAASTPSPPPLSDAQAASQATQAFDAAPQRGADGTVPLVTVEQQGTHLDITTTSVATPEEAAATATDAAQGNDLLKVVADTPVHTADVGTSVPQAGTSTDPSRPSQWALDQAGFESAWSRTDGGCLVVAVVDTGVQSDHPDLAGQVLGGERFTTNSNTGATMDPAIDDAGHGTHVAGIIAAVANNGTGIAGAAPGVKILPVKVLDASGSGWDSDVARGIDWAVQHGAKVINLSLGGCTPGASDTAVTNAVAHGVMVFAAAGNDGNSSSGCGVNAPSYPGASAAAIAVASVNSNLAHSSYSTVGSYVDIAAPGNGILSTYPTSTYATLSGTSMATPYAAATGALIRALHPSWTPAQATQQLESTATDLGAPGLDSSFGWGFINPSAAVN